MSNNEPSTSEHTGQHGGPGDDQWSRVRIPGADQGSARRPATTPKTPNAPAPDDDEDETPTEDPRTHTTGG